MAPFKNLTMSFLCLVCPVVYLIKHLWACPAVTLTRPSATNHSQVINIVFPAFSACEPPSQDPGHFLELLASSQSRRLDDQRVSLSHFPGLRFSTSNLPRTPSTSSADQVPTQGFTLMRFHLLPLSLLTLWLMPFFFSFFFFPVPVTSTDAPHKPSLHSQLEASTEQPEGDEVFFDMLVKCQVRSSFKYSTVPQLRL